MSSRGREELYRAFERWGYDTRGWTRETRRTYVTRVRQADAWLIRERGVNLLWAGPKDLQAFLFSTPPTARNRNHIRAALIGFGDFVVAQGFTDTNAAARLPRLPEPRSIPRALSTEEARRVVAGTALLPLRDRTLVLTFLYCALRLSEARSMEWSSLDAGWLRVNGKGGKTRMVPIPPPLAACFGSWKVVCPDPRYVFPGRFPGHPMGVTTIGVMVRELGQTVGVTGLHPHKLRHTAATALLELTGGDIRTVQEYLGHANPNTTAIYTHVRPARLRESVMRLDYGPV